MPAQSHNGARIISVGGGKGGVGKSLIAGNLAVAYAQQGLRVVLVDADLGSANQHTLFGVDRPTTGLVDFLDRRVSNLAEAASPTSVANLRLVVGTGAVPNAANIHHTQKHKLMRHIKAVDADVVVVDVGAGSSHMTVDFFDLGDARVVVVTPQLTSIQNAYGFLKASVLRMFHHLCHESAAARALDAATRGRETDRIDDILNRLQLEDSDLHATLRSALARFDARMIGNQVTQAQDAGVFRGVGRMVRDFLGIPLPLAGFLATAQELHDSVNRRTPLLLLSPHHANSVALRAIADTLLHDLPMPQVDRQQDHRRVRHDDDVSNFIRQQPRVDVNWQATLEQAGHLIQVRVLDVSAGGVGIKSPYRLTNGTTYNLTLNQPELNLTVQTSVKNFDPQGDRVGLAYLRNDGAAQRIFKQAQAEASPL